MSPVARTTATRVVLLCWSVLLAACTIRDELRDRLGDEPRQCAAGQTLCGTACVRLDSNDESCGACGNACSDGKYCLAGVCTCPAELATCGNWQATVCSDLKSDPANCGVCGNACQAPLVCFFGECRCPLGQSLCDDECVALDSDPENCGLCGNVCPAPLPCTQGRCECEAGSSLCGDRCASIVSSENCGACGAFCPEGFACETYDAGWSNKQRCVADGSLVDQPPEHLDFEFGGARPHAAAIGDLDADGLRDLLVLTDSVPGSTVTPEVHWLRGTGGGRFAAPVLLWAAGDKKLGGEPLQISVARMRPAPAAPQVVLSSSNVCLLFPAGMLEVAPPTVIEVGARCLAFDADGDGLDELATWWGLARLGEDGSLSDFTKPRYWGGTPQAAVDFDGDGLLDLFTPRLLRNRGNGEFWWSPFPVLTTSYYQSLAVDLDGDGVPEVVLSGKYETLVLRRDAASSFGFEKVSNWSSPVGKVAAGDFDGDGLAELVTSREAATGASYVVQNHAGTLSGRIEAPWTGLGADLQDADGDGRSEVLVFTETGLRVYLPQPGPSTWPVP